MRIKSFSLAMLVGIAALGLVGCSTMLPAKATVDECLVIIKTTYANTRNSEGDRRYGLNFSASYPSITISDKSEDYIAVKIGEAGMKIVSVSSWVSGAHVTGARRENKVDIKLPYEPGRVVIADFKFVQKTYQSGTYQFMSTGKFEKMSAEEKAALVQKLSSTKNYETWLQ